jgi:hypothetical protein
MSLLTRETEEDPLRRRLAIDPLTKILPVLHLGPRTQNVAHLLIHSLRQILAAFLPPTLHQ